MSAASSSGLAQGSASSTPATRKVRIGGSKTQGAGAGPDESFPGNKIKTTKYTRLNFVPVNLWEQLHKFGNVYFLCISVLMWLGEHTTLFIGTIKSFSTIATLIPMMAISAAVALLDDKRRGEADKAANSQTAIRVSRTGEEETTKWEDIAVGDVLHVKDDQEFPADLVPLFCSGAEGTCYVSTANLDGETNLKLKSAMSTTQHVCAERLAAAKAAKNNQLPEKKSSIRSLPGKIDVCEMTLKNSLPELLRKIEMLEVEAPQASIHDFSGRAVFASGTDNEPLGAKQLLLRGTVLRNTGCCLGVVVYTGPQTRMVMNTRETPCKQSNLERVTNAVMLVVLASIGLLALLSDAVFNLNKGSFQGLWYLTPPDLILPDWFSYWLTFCVLYSNMMPISLYPTMEWCNAWQAYFIKNDLKMYWKELDFPAGVSSSNLCQELGQVGYIFSDKTGTLTQNVMELKRLWIRGQPYGKLVANEKGFNGGGELKNASNNGRKDEIDNFLEVLAVAHTAVITQKDGAVHFEAESPDESALVEAVAELGWRFTDRVGEQVKVTDPAKKEVSYQIRAVNAFDSARKRMSVVVQRDQEYFLFAKGADNVMMDRSSKESKKTEKELESALGTFAGEGLRTLVVSRRALTKGECEAWLKKYHEAQQAMTDRDGELAKVAEELEVDMEIVGVTAIEDKLQAHVPETIERLREAGINLWVLTGDKLETARNIGFSARVLTSSMTIATFDKELAGTSQAMSSLVSDEASKLSGLDTENKAVMVTGAALELIFGDVALKGRFLDLAKACSVVIACRVSPLQKAQMVRLVREGVKPTPVTLSVGDGANDVPMIQEAQVGVGIAGREGRQAVNNSDFAIGQFSYLQRLLLVHGRWNYRRVCKFTLFTFWRNAVQVLLIFFYTFVSGYSGTSIFEDWIRLSFNFLCSFPIMATGCFDQDVTDRVAIENPKLYGSGRLGNDLNTGKIVQALFSAVGHAMIIWTVAWMAYPSMELLGVSDYYSWGTAVYTVLVFDMNYRVAFLNYTHNRYTIGTIVASFLCYMLYLVVYPCTRLFADIFAPNMYMVPYQLVVSTPFWLCVVAVPAVMINVDMFLLLLSRQFDQRRRVLADLRKDVMQKAGRSVARKRGGSNYDHFLVPPEAGEEEEEQEVSATPPAGVDVSAFAQQKHRGLYFDGSHRLVRLASFLAGLLLFVLGLLAHSSSTSMGQLRIHYQGDGYDTDPLGTTEEEVVHAQSTCHGVGKTCTFKAKVAQTMRPPILVYYGVGPYYQNYNYYMKSEVSKELLGKPVPAGLREKMCLSYTRVDAQGKEIVPCGMKAFSMFNDTFTIKGVEIDKHGVAWESDVQRYNNPAGYPNKPQTSWLHDRYPGVVTQEDGVKSEQFVAWMRPAALPHLVKRYGWINQELKDGTELEITIQNVYPVDGFEGYKHLVLTELGSFGGRHHGFGYALLVCGALCMVLGAAVAVMAYCQDGASRRSFVDSDPASRPLIPDGGTSSSVSPSD